MSALSSTLRVLPAFVDLHAHFREPGLTHKEDIESGSRAAVRGGYTSVVLMANTKPVCDSMEIVNHIRARAREIGLIDIEPAVAITKNLEGKSIAHLEKLDDTIKYVSDDGSGVMDDEIMEKVLAMSLEKNFTVISHAEDHNFSATDMREAENRMTARDIALSLKTGGRLHLTHVSTKEAVQMIIEAKKRGANLTCDVTPHHIFATDEIAYRVNPPLRKQDDVESIISAIKDGYIDAIATDHAPHTLDDKANGAPGISGIETAFQICLTKLVKEGHISLEKLSALMSPGRLIKDYSDFVLVDIEAKSKINVDNFASKGKNSPFHGREVFGKILRTFKGGKIVYESGEQ